MTRRPALALLLLPALLVGCDAFGGGDEGRAEDSAARLYPVQQDGKRALIDKTGRVAVDLSRYNKVRDGAEGLVPARYWDGRNVWDFYGADGQVAFSASVDEAYAPREGRARVRIDGRWAFLDGDGRFLINPYLNDARDFSEGRAAVRTTSWTWGMMDRSGVLVVEPQWGSLGPLRGGRARFEDDGAHGFVDAEGETVIEAAYDDARDFSGGRAAVRQGQRWFYIDAENGRPLGSQTFISAGDFSEGLAPVRTENKWEYVGEDGARRIGPQFDEARAFRDGRAAVEVDGRWTFVRPDGSLLREPEFDEVEDFSGGLAAVVVGGAVGYVDREGAYVWFPRD